MFMNPGLIFDTNVVLYIYIFSHPEWRVGANLAPLIEKPRAGADSTVFLHKKM